MLAPRNGPLTEPPIREPDQNRQEPWDQGASGEARGNHDESNGRIAMRNP